MELEKTTFLAPIPTSCYYSSPCVWARDMVLVSFPCIFQGQNNDVYIS